MKVWVVKHKPTGEWMPARMNRQGRGGWSWWIPGTVPDGLAGCSNGFDKNPRVFFTRVSAQRAASQWLRGPMATREHFQGSGYFEPPESYTTVDLVEVPGIPPRRPQDLEIVEGELTL